MLNYNEIMEIPPYSLSLQEKKKLLTQKLVELTKHHYEGCSDYKKIIDCLNFDVEKINSYYDIPFLPVGLFKEFDMFSVNKTDIFKTMT